MLGASGRIGAAHSCDVAATTRATPAPSGDARDIAHLLAAMQHAGQVSPGCPVGELDRHLDHPVPGRQHIEEHPDLDAPTTGQGQRRGESGPGDTPHPVEGLSELPAGARRDRALRQADDPPATPGGVRPRDVGDGQVGFTGQHGPNQRSQIRRTRPEVGIDEQHRPRSERIVVRRNIVRARHHGRCLAVIGLVPHHARTSGLGQPRGGVAATVVDNDYQIDMRQSGGRRHRGGDPRGLVLGGDHDGDAHGDWRGHGNLDQRSVTWRLIRPDRAPRSAAVRGASPSAAAYRPVNALIASS